MQTMQTISVANAIESRRSIRRYDDLTVPQEELTEILRLTGLAPSAWNVQPWRFHVITDVATKERLQEAAYGQKQVTSAPVVMVLASDMEDVMANLEETAHPGMGPEGIDRHKATLVSAFGGQSVQERGQWALAQTNIALGFLLIAAQGMGYSTCPMLGFEHVKVKEILGIPEHAHIAAMVTLGVADEDGYPHHRHDLNRIVTYH